MDMTYLLLHDMDDRIVSLLAAEGYEVHPAWERLGTDNPDREGLLEHAAETGGIIVTWDKGLVEQRPVNGIVLVTEMADPYQTVEAIADEIDSVSSLKSLKNQVVRVTPHEFFSDHPAGQDSRAL